MKNSMRFFPDNQCRILALLVGALLLWPQAAAGNDLKRVKASYTYYAPSAMSVEQARITAFNRAVTKALTDVFGLRVSQTNTTVISDTDGHAKSHFLSVGESDVRGEWIETIGEPKYQIDYHDDLLIVNVWVEGMARLKSENAPQFAAKPLRNGTRPQDASTEFHDGDQLFVQFSSHVDGYVAMFLLDYANKYAIRLLPYSSMPNGPVMVNGGMEYLFFSTAKADAKQMHAIDEVELTCEVGTEINGLCILFASTPFPLPALSTAAIQSDLTPPLIDLTVFQKWFSRIRTDNPAISTATINLSIINTTH